MPFSGPAGEKRLDSSDAAAWVLGQVMLPDTKHTPAMLAQCPCDKTISGDVGGELLFPERPIVYRQVGVFGAPMPETAIHKYNDPLAAKGEVRFSKMKLTATPAGDAMGTEKFGKREFSVLVAMPANTGHNFRPLRPGENIRRFIRKNSHAAIPSGFISCV